AALIRAEVGPDTLRMMDANQVWDVDEAVAAMTRLVDADPYWIEEPTHADDVLGHARIAAEVARLSGGRCRVATGEAAANRVIFKQLLQADAIGVCQVDACRRSEEHTSELQSRENLVCRLLLEKKNPRSS